MLKAPRGNPLPRGERTQSPRREPPPVPGSAPGGLRRGARLVAAGTSSGFTACGYRQIEEEPRNLQAVRWTLAFAHLKAAWG